MQEIDDRVAHRRREARRQIDVAGPLGAGERPASTWPPVGPGATGVNPGRSGGRDEGSDHRPRPDGRLGVSEEHVAAASSCGSGAGCRDEALLPGLSSAALAALVVRGDGRCDLLRQSRDLDEPHHLGCARRARARARDPAGELRRRAVPPLPGRLLPARPPGQRSAYRSNGWLADALRGAGRRSSSFPQGARDSDTDPEYLDWGAGRNWETYIAKELPRYIDAHFRTIRSRSGRAIVGLSAGGYGATIVGLRHPGTFSVIESWSGYFHPTDPTGTQAARPRAAANAHRLIGAPAPAAAADVLRVLHRPRRPPVPGRERALDRELTAAQRPAPLRALPGRAPELWSARTRIGAGCGSRSRIWPRRRRNRCVNRFRQRYRSGSRA